MNLLLDNVVSDITGKTGMTIIRAILGGERDPALRDNIGETFPLAVISVEGRGGPPWQSGAGGLV